MMNTKLFKKIAGVLGYKLIDKNHAKNSRLCAKFSSINIKNILNNFFENQLINSVIQIGANDGHSFDELSFFLKKFKITSILVDPIPEFFDELKLNYSKYDNIKLENVAISEHDNNTFLYSVKKRYRDNYGGHAKAISSFNLNHLLKHGIKKQHIEKLNINSISIKNLLNKYKLKSIDLLYVDAEGYDGEIILSFLNEEIDCKAIIFEFIHIKNKLFMKLIDKLKSKNFHFFQINENLVCINNKEKIKILI